MANNKLFNDIQEDAFLLRGLSIINDVYQNNSADLSEEDKATAAYYINKTLSELSTRLYNKGQELI